MIALTRLNGKDFWLNPDLVECMEKTPDTVITLKDGRKLVVSESPEDIINKIVAYRQTIYVRLPRDSTLSEESS